MKKIKLFGLIILTMVFLISPISMVVADGEETETKSKINVYMFRGEGCPHCEEALEFFDKLAEDEEYSNYYNLVKYEVWYDETNAELMQKVAKELKEEASGVPYIVIGEKTFSGYASSYDDQIKEAIKTAYESDDYKDVVKSVKGSTKKTKEVKESSPIVPIIVIGGVAIVVIAGIVVLAKKL